MLVIGPLLPLIHPRPTTTENSPKRGTPVTSALTSTPQPPTATSYVTTAPQKPFNPLTPETLTWLPSLGLTRDNQTWIYSLPNGHQFPISTTGLISAVTKTPQQIDQIMATKDIWKPRGELLHLILEAMVNQRWNPSPPAGLQVPHPGDYEAWSTPLLESPLWDRITVVGSELMAYCPRKNVAGTIDLVLAFDDGTYGIADLKTQGTAKSQTYDTKPQLGAGVDFIGQHYGLLFSRCLTLWSRPGVPLHVQTHDAQECLSSWLDACEQYTARLRPF